LIRGSGENKFVFPVKLPPLTVGYGSLIEEVFRLIRTGYRLVPLTVGSVAEFVSGYCGVVVCFIVVPSNWIFVLLSAVVREEFVLFLLQAIKEAVNRDNASTQHKIDECFIAIKFLS
jgi:hypothetical protein